MADDIVADAKRQVDNRVSGSTPSQDDPLIWVSGSGITVPKRGTLGKNQLKVSEMKQSVLAAAANRDPYFSTLANSLYATNFISKSSRNIPEYVAAGLENAINVYQAYVSTGGDKSFSDWWGGYVQSAPPREEDGGRYTGPVATRTVAAESDVRATADAVALEMLGRSVTDEEYDRILKRTRKAEQAQPQITTSGRGYSTTEQGLSAQGRQDIVENILAKKPEYQEFQKATTLMSWFDEALNRRMQQNV